jgi:hypothetical protein
MPALVQPTAWLRDLRRRDRLLWAVGLLHLGLLVASAPGLVLDPRLVGGVNPWIKPIKFDVSIVVYVWTMAWLLGELPRAFAARMARGIAASMLVETVCINSQAWRGVLSHFNRASAYDGAVFTVMGIAIVYNTYLLFRVALQFIRRPPPELAIPSLRGIQLGLVMALVGSVLGAFMSAQPGHAVGVADGGPGLPVLNWSTEGGDLRVAHFFGLHGLQLLPLLGAWLTAARRRPTLLYGVFAAQLAVTLALFALALAGLPLWRGA